jgi:MscS family membrane protein
VIVGLFFAFEYIDIDQSVDLFGRQVIKSLVAFAIFWSVFRALTPLSYVSSSLGKLLTPMMMQWIFKAMRVAVIFLGLAVILEIWGIKVAPLLAGFGLFGVAVALGAQDFFKNLIAGMTIIAEKRFSIGDWIKVDGVVEGTVEDIGFRSTSIRRFDKAPVHVPNAHLSDTAVTNFTRMSHRRIYWVIGVTYSTTTDQLKTIRDGIMRYIEAQDSFDKDVSTFVRVDSFNNSSIDIMVYCFTKTTVWGEWLEIKEDFAFEIKRVVEEEAGASFAFPSTSLYVESWPDGEKPESFSPPKKATSTKKAKK